MGSISDAINKILCDWYVFGMIWSFLCVNMTNEVFTSLVFDIIMINYKVIIQGLKKDNPQQLSICHLWRCYLYIDYKNYISEMISYSKLCDIQVLYILVFSKRNFFN